MPASALRRALLRWLAALPAAVAAGAAGAAPLDPAPRDRTPFEAVALDAPDGDTVVVRTLDGRRLRVRIAGIDAPEARQPFADVSRRHLRTLLHERRLRIEPVDRDRYDRVVARVFALDAPAPGREADPAAAHDVGLAMLEAGLAWHFARYRVDRSRAVDERYARAERDARARRAGLWRDPSAEPPWAFRERTRRPETAPERPSPPDPAG
jgi:endonuclease YncB( thermonuclease family)